MKVVFNFNSLAAIALVLAVAPTSASADRRAFVHTYEYMTMPKGDVELEIWNTQSRTEFGDNGLAAFQLQLELEYGITPRWDIALYQVFAQADGATPEEAVPLGFAETKIETRYRFAERGQWPVDTLVYFEVAKAFGETEWEFEPKLILARDFGKLNVVVNLIPEIKLEEEVDEMTGDEEVEPEFEPGWAVGASYEVGPELKLGAESFGAVEHGDELQLWAGPSVSWAPSHKIWIAATAGFGLTEDSDDFVFRFITGVGL